MATNNHINYIEFKAKDLGTIKHFYTSVFEWEFTDSGDRYIAFSNSGMEGGFEFSEEPVINGALVVLDHDNLEETQQKLESAGGIISVPIFSFPGERRFHFVDPAGNELAVWSE